ncbi:MAG TPA: imidazoleglycerol-phosphate dehydratase HisB [Phycisphaerae bacterium]|nr:imidazoleglycerol-phosphate dehydratase HisB [Phycisphaerae bacterium]
MSKKSLSHNPGNRSAASRSHTSIGTGSKAAPSRKRSARPAAAQRRVVVERQTKETRIRLALNLDGTGKASIDTGVGFFDHMLTHIARHGLIDIDLKARGDLHVDDHHTVEDVGICLGEAIARAVGDKKGIRRYGFFITPMEESLAQVVVDLSGRAAVVYRAKYRGSKIGTFDVQLVEEFLRAVACNAKMNLHVGVPYGTNNHHIAEAVFKAFGKALRAACEIDPRESSVPSTKGVL